MNLSIGEMAEKLKEYQEFRIIYHIRPDGDCMGSAYALALALKALGAKCEVAGQDPVPGLHREMTEKVEMDVLGDPVYVSVDTATPARAGKYSGEHFTFCIDHHRDNSVQADYKYVEEDCGACAEIILKLIKAMGVSVTKEMADFPYTALVMDTMCFRTTATSVQSFETAAELKRLGADVYRIGRRTMYIKTPQRIQIEQRLRDSFHYASDGKLITGVLTLKDLQEVGILDSELEGINSLAEQVMGLKIGVTVRELPDGRSRCSVRTSEEVDASEICRLLGGGGHKHAACCELDCSPEKARKVMEEHCRKFLPG